jgi:putative phosphoesterase
VRLGIVSDIHCNTDALRLALDRMGAVDELLCAGDAIYEYRFSNEVIALLKERKTRYVLGNHEAVFLDPRGIRARQAPTVRQDYVEFMAAQPRSLEVHVGGGKKLVMVHASPLEPFTQYVWPGSPELRRLAEIEADYVILGHTHSQMAERAGDVLVINPGSTGEARDLRNGRKLSYAILDTSSGELLFDNFLPGDLVAPEFVPAQLP